jgi:predicted  nucleic acid-binding Zn-ribbon protein
VESNPKEVNENLQKAKKIKEKLNKEIEPLAKNIFGLESLIKVIEQNSDKFEELKKVL